MIDDARLFAASQEVSRALSVTQEYVEEAKAADQGVGLPSIAYERARAAEDALVRAETTLAGIRWVVGRARMDFAGQSDMDAA